MAVEQQKHNAMKAIFSRTSILLATVFVLGSAHAAKPIVDDGSSSNKRSTLERNLDRALNRHLSFPVNAKENMTGDVYVSFVIDQVGRVEVLDCRSENPSLKEYVLRKLARIAIGANPDGVWRTTHMHIVFKPEKANS